MLYRKLHGYKYQTLQHRSYVFPDDLFLGLPEGAIINTEHGYIRLELGQRSIQISKGYCWDGPSGPTIDTDNFMLGSLIHDAMYQLMREYPPFRAYRNDADEALRRICIEEGMSSLRARWVYWGVKTFGRRAAGG
jgi:hypothetical protein